MYDATSYYGRRGAVIHAHQRARHRAVGPARQGHGQAAARAAGPTKREGCWPTARSTRLGDTPDEVRRNIDRGLKLGLQGHQDRRRSVLARRPRSLRHVIRTAREHVGIDIRLMVDAATAWGKAEEGLPLMPLFKEHGFAWVEAPLPLDDLEGHARFQGFGVPIGGGDLGLTTCAEYREMFDIGKIDIAQPDVTMVGRPYGTDAPGEPGASQGQARRHPRLQVEHHDCSEPRLPVAA